MKTRMPVPAKTLSIQIMQISANHAQTSIQIVKSVISMGNALSVMSLQTPFPTKKANA